ncbi:MAG TPA: transposase [Gaiellaceae bacterium]|nr:transposase [Gaiellaceae bacterium]
MPRPPRAFVDHGIYHVASRGSDRQPLFSFDGDRSTFLERLTSIVERYELACVAYCLMGNHYHLVVQTPDSRLSRALQELHGGYSRHFNRVHGRSAHLFRNRFLARLIDGDAYLLAACRYVARNPVRAGLCGRASDWPWSSYRATAGLVPTPPLLSESLLRDACGGTANWRKRYQDFVEQPVEETSQNRDDQLLTAAGV